MIMSPMKVTYRRHMGDDLTVVDAARVSFDKESEWETGFKMSDEDGGVHYGEPCRLMYSKLSEQDTKLINYLAKHNHWSPFAHTSIQLRVKAPIFVARQLVKHQVGGVWNEVSRRYVDSEPEFWFPEVWRGRPVNAKQGSSGVVKNVRFHDANGSGVEYQVGPTIQNFITHSLGIYEDLLDGGVAPEQARMVLPQNMQTEWIWTGSLMFWCRVCRERLAPGAQAETREIAEQIAEIVAPLFPVSWSALMGSDGA